MHDARRRQQRRPPSWIATSCHGTEPAAAKARRPGLRRKVLLVAAAVTIGLLAVGGGTAASLAKHVTITVDGEQRQVTTLAGSVRGRAVRRRTADRRA